MQQNEVNLIYGVDLGDRAEFCENAWFFFCNFCFISYFQHVFICCFIRKDHCHQQLLKGTVCKISMDTIFLCPFNQLSIIPYEIKWLIFYFFWKSNLSCQPSRVTNQPLFVIKQLFIKRVSRAIINLRIAHFNKTLLCITFGICGYYAFKFL